MTKFLDTEKRITAEYNEQYVRIPFASGDILSIMQSKMNGGLIGGRTYVFGGITGNNEWNLAITVETNILAPLQEYGYIDSFEKVTSNRTEPKYIIRRSVQ